MLFYDCYGVLIVSDLITTVDLLLMLLVEFPLFIVILHSHYSDC